LKQDIHDTTGIPVRSQRLVFAGKLLDDDTFFCHDFFKEGNQVNLKLDSRSYMQVFIKFADKELCPFQPQASENTIEDIKLHIKETEGYLVAQQHLSLEEDGESLANHHTMSQCNIAARDTVYLAVEQRN